MFQWTVMFFPLQLCLTGAVKMCTTHLQSNLFAEFIKLQVFLFQFAPNVSIAIETLLKSCGPIKVTYKANEMHWYN